MKVRPFWGSTWATRGISFSPSKTLTWSNIHYRDLVFQTGVNWKIKRMVAIRTWKRLFRLLLGFRD